MSECVDWLPYMAASVSGFYGVCKSSRLLLSRIAAIANDSDLLLHTVVCLSVGHVCEPCKNGWTDWDAVWGLIRVDPGNHVLDGSRCP